MLVIYSVEGNIEGYLSNSFKWPKTLYFIVVDMLVEK